MHIKLQEILKGGLENLQVVLDFDRTITYGAKMDGQTPSVISFLRLSNMLGEDYYKAANANFAKYHPMEVDSTMDKEEQIKQMQIWWEAHLQMVVDFGLTLQQIKEIANTTQLVLRPGMLELFKFCQEKDVPIIIFSANVLGHESIKFFLERFGIYSASVTIVTNELIFDENGKSTGFKKPAVHSKNKDESMILHGLQRPNTILIGDGISDAEMVKDEPNEVVFRFGIVDENNQIKVAQYAQVFDVVVTPNGSFDILKLVEDIKEKTR